jgi:ATPase family associated with various cellular activities (AAA)
MPSPSSAARRDLQTPPSPAMTPATVQAILRKTIPARLPVLLLGAPGVGKTAIVNQLAKDLDRSLVVSHPVTTDPTAYSGLPWIVDGRASFLPIGDLARLEKLDGKPGIWLIDDLGQALATTQAAVMQLVHPDGRALNGFKVPDDVAIIACSNRPQDRAGVGAFLAPLVSRFVTVLTIEPEPVSFVHWAISRGGFNPLVASFIRWKPEYLLDRERPAHSLEQQCSPRTWEHVSRLLDLGFDDTQLSHLVPGAITPSIATEFLAYLQVYKSLPNADRVRADPDGAPLPATPDATFATAVHLAGAATPADFPLFCRFMDRSAPEYQLLFMLTATTRRPELTHSTAYIEWASRPDNVVTVN